MTLPVGIFLISFSLLAYEILLMRIFSITSWSHFAYMIISVALLGFGASGSFLFFYRESIKKNFNFLFLLFSFLYGVALFFSARALQLIPLNPFLILWYHSQYLYLFLTYIICFIPFFLGANCIGMSFIHRGSQIPRLYLFNMVGSGVGTLGVMLLMYLFFPSNVLLIISLLGLLASVIFSVNTGKRYFFSVLSLFMGVGILFYLHPLELKISEYKGLSMSLNLPEAEVVKEYFSPFGLIHILKSPAIRYAPGLSFNFQGETPSQLAIFTDADSVSVINRFPGEFSSLEYLDYLTSSVPYYLLESPQVLVLGAGGGSEVLSALYHGAIGVDAVEVNPQIIKIIKEDYADFAGNIYSLARVKPVLAEARGYVESTSRNYDLIQISLLDSFAASSAGVYAFSESYLYTVEAMIKFLDKLSPRGILCVTRWTKTPPRDGIRILATVTEALEKMNTPRPSDHIIMIRSWSTSTLLVQKAPFSFSQIKEVIEFSKKRAFDICWYPGITPDEVNRFHILPQPYFYQAAKEIFSPDRERFYEDYLFDIRPTRDDSPYFFHFFKWRSLPYLKENLGKQWIPFIEWGYIILIFTLVQAIIASVVFILVPLFFLPKKPSFFQTGQNLSDKLYKKNRLRVFLYFLSLGISYMFLEISFIQRFILFLHYPVYTVAVVITGFLLFSGLGSGFSSRFVQQERRGITFAFIAIATFAIFYLFFLKRFFLVMIGFPDWAKIGICLGFIFPLAFFMGMLFPLGLSRVSRKAPFLVPWAWGINGCASVISSVLATVLAVGWGFTLIGTVSILLYFLAYLTCPFYPR